MKNVIIICSLILAAGCTTGETARSDNLGDHQQSTRTTYFLGIPIFEERRIETTELPD